MAKKQSPTTNTNEAISRRLREGVVICLGAASLFLLLSLITYHSSDPSWTYSGSGGEVKNSAGRVGAYLADTFLQLFGYVAYIFPFMIGYMGFLIFRERELIDHHDWH
ncbi:MAG: DNA translocase FtsK 4TM domain-containing protein, partial [Kangiellaceae bacterium]|nr:DNA translocase FtsK 4TM domain-containing protein [Kangiellaceae bacterium]